MAKRLPFAILWWSHSSGSLGSSFGQVQYLKEFYVYSSLVSLGLVNEWLALTIFSTSSQCDRGPPEYCWWTCSIIPRSCWLPWHMNIYKRLGCYSNISDSPVPQSACSFAPSWWPSRPFIFTRSANTTRLDLSSNIWWDWMATLQSWLSSLTQSTVEKREGTWT